MVVVVVKNSERGVFVTVEDDEHSSRGRPRMTKQLFPALIWQILPRHPDALPRMLQSSFVKMQRAESDVSI